jgi:citrate lyase beta subunit
MEVFRIPMSLAPRSMLFVSGETPARFAKATSAGADLVCLDLEDAVHSDRKAIAREAVFDFVAQQNSGSDSCPLAVRINALNTPEGLHDIQALVTAKRKPDAVIFPKIEHARDIVLVRSWFGQTCPKLIALIESPAGIQSASDIASAHLQVPELLALMLGGADLCLELGAEFEWQSLLLARSLLVNAAKSCGLQAWDVPHINLNDPEQLKAETVAVRRMGFNCKTAIHPKQLSIIHSAWQANVQELQWAHAVLDQYEERVRNKDQNMGAFLHEGRLIDEPIIRRARQLVTQSQVSSPDSKSVNSTDTAAFDKQIPSS